MSDLLTREEYAGIAGTLDLPRTAFIDGRYRPGNGATLAATNPATGETICEIAACNDADVAFAAGKAREAFSTACALDGDRNPEHRPCVLTKRLVNILTGGQT